ncbi:MAG: glycosyltransferase family 2 protein [Gemmataceae bacterium]|nr:glycosyltransferase family 2 protein [Gemmataceae bacterium]MDW8241717.1 glycosyltransferase family 2 protein [Thermogemmata sp.]
MPPLVAEIQQVWPDRGMDQQRLEIIVVDDGSTDGSWEVIQQLAQQEQRLQGLRLRRNFGKAAALQAGFHAARGKIVITLDGDLQDDPQEIPRFVAAIEQGADVVSGWKVQRQDPWHKVIPSRIFNRLVSWLTGVRLHDHNCGFKAYRAEVLRELHLYGEQHRFVPVLAAERGFRISELPVRHRPRRFGHSKYRWQRFIKGLLDLGTVFFLTQYEHRPQHLLGTTGLLCGTVAGVGLMVSLLVALLTEPAAWSSLAWALWLLLLISSATAALISVQLLTVGLLAELIVVRTMSQQENYSVAERTLPPGTKTNSSSRQNCSG